MTLLSNAIDEFIKIESGFREIQILIFILIYSNTRENVENIQEHL